MSGLVDRVYIVGAGRMGQGIALAFIFAGVPAVLIDVKDRSEQQRKHYFAGISKAINQELQMMAALQLIDAGQIPGVMQRLTCIERSAAQTALTEAELVFEAVPEVMEIKQDALAWLGRHTSSRTVVASTTSTFLVTKLAGLITHPQRFLNAHWLNPAQLMPLVEISSSDTTSETARQYLIAILKKIGKVPVLCNASAGYIVPRIQSLAMAEAARMVEEGVASAQDIDTAVRVGFGLRFAVLGLLEFIDWGGGDILYYASNYLADELDERFRSPQIVQDNMRSGRNGVREGQGFYDYRDIDIDAYKQGRLKDFTVLLRALKLAPLFNVVIDSDT